MNARQALALTVTMILGLVLGGLFSWQPSFAQPKLEQVTVGRYQVAVTESSVANSQVIMVIDTATRQLWTKVGSNPKQSPWEDLGSPPVRGGGK